MTIRQSFYLRRDIKNTKERKMTMIELEKILNLQKILEDLTSVTNDLNDDIVKLKGTIDAGEFLEEALNYAIKEKLEKISLSQKEFASHYETLEKGPVPKRMSDANACLIECQKEIEGKEKYEKVIQFFLKLTSEEESTNCLLKEHKKILRSMNIENISSEELKERLEKYVLVFDAYNETNMKKKFSYIYKLSTYFEEEIVTEINFGTLKVSELEEIEQEKIESEEVVLDEVIPEESTVEESITLEETVIEDTTIEEITIEEITIEEVPSQEELTWEKLGIEDPETVIVSENLDLLHSNQSLKADTKFGVKEFKRDIAKQMIQYKLETMVTGEESCGFTKESIALARECKTDAFEIAIEKLYQMGYLKKYRVDNLGEFFVLSSRGRKAFLSRESLSFINKYIYPPISMGTADEIIEDTCNSAIIRLLSFATYQRTVDMDENYIFDPRRKQQKKEPVESIIGTDYFLRKFSEVWNEKTIQFVGITSENIQEFELFLDDLSSTIQDIQILIVVGYTQTHAKMIAKWIRKMLKTELKDCSIWYCVAKKNEYYDSFTDEKIKLDEYKETVKEDSVTENIVEETAIEDVIEENITQESELEEGVVEENVTKVKISQEPPKVVVKETNKEEVVCENVIVEEKVLEASAKKDYDKIYQEMLMQHKFYAATLYLKVLSKKMPCYENVYRQLAYALNDPMENCSYNSDNIFNVYYNNEVQVSEHYVVAAAIRNYFFDQFRYDYSLPQLQAALNGNSILNSDSVLNRIVYTLQKFKTDYYDGMDKYADYRKKEQTDWENRLEEIQKIAKGYYDKYCASKIKENISNPRFVETEKLMFGPESDLKSQLGIVINDDREFLEILEEDLKETYIKENAFVSRENIDSEKLSDIILKYWNLAERKMKSNKKTANLMSELRMNLTKKIIKIVEVLCDYVVLMKAQAANEDDPGLKEYKKIRMPLLKDIAQASKHLVSKKVSSIEEKAGNAVLLTTLQEIEERLSGTYKESEHKYFYVNFLKNDKVLLDEEYFPVFDEVIELPELSLENRIELHCKGIEFRWEERLQEIFSGQDDYGSAELILSYMQHQNIVPEKVDLNYYDVEKAIVFPKKDIEHKRKEFIEDLELAQSYGQIDNTVENSKEIMIQIMDTWYAWALETKNYGFFIQILNGFRNKIKKDAQARAGELEISLNTYLERYPDWDVDEVIYNTVEKIKDRIGQQNYAAAEDLLNRLMTNDLESENTFEEVDYFQKFWDEYSEHHKDTANPSMTLKSLMKTTKMNKDIKGGNRLLENWPKSASVGEFALKNLLTSFGFQVGEAKKEKPIQGKIESYVVTLKKPENGRKSNYKHPIAIFGSEAETNGFRVVCLFGRTDATRLIDTFKEIGNAKNTIVILDYALSPPDRKRLARKAKTDLSGKTFAVIDRVVAAFLAKNYTETAVNRMLMAIIMPFASYQPYIDKSADVMPPEIFMGRKIELEKIESPTGVNIVYGGRQLGKTALLRMAKKDIDRNENGDRAVIVNVWGKDYKEAAKTISEALYDEKILRKENITDDWSILARDIKNRLREDRDKIPYFLLMIDEADVFIESCEAIGYQPFNELKDIQSVGSGRFKFVVAGLRNIVRFKRTAALGNNSVLTHLESLTVKPFKTLEARELLEVPLSYLGFRFPKDNETEVLISTIFGTTNYFPGLIQLYCSKLIEAVQRDYAGYSEDDTPPYEVRKEQIKKVLAEQTLQTDIRNKFFITLKVDEDDYYYVIALLTAYHYHKVKTQNGCSVTDLIELSEAFEIEKLLALGEEKLVALMEEMQELNVLQHMGNGRYRFARHSFCQMMGSVQQIEDELMKYMGE